MGTAMHIHYLEIVTKDVDAVCATYERLHGVTFGAADAGLGGARTAPLPDGGMLGVRAPMELPGHGKAQSSAASRRAWASTARRDSFSLPSWSSTWP